MKRTRIAIALIVLWVAGLRGQAGPIVTLPFGSAHLRIGMRGDSALALVGAEFTVHRSRGLEGSWQAYRRADALPTDSDFYGVLSIKNGRLSSVTRFWQSAEDSPGGFAAMLADALSDLPSSKSGAWTVSRACDIQRSEPTGEIERTVRLVLVQCGRYELTLSISTRRGGLSSVSVSTAALDIAPIRRP
jgi:hypothetical protein